MTPSDAAIAWGEIYRALSGNGTASRTSPRVTMVEMRSSASELTAQNQMSRPPLFVLSIASLLTACGGGGGAPASPNGPAATISPRASASPKPIASASPAPVATATATPTSTPSPAPALGPAGTIKHVVIIIQENRSFDNLFHGFPGADTVASGTTSTGQVVTLQPLGLENSQDLDHTHLAWYRTYADGKLYFDLISRNLTIRSTVPYSYVPPAETQPYFALGEKYTVGDRMFQSNTGPSFVAHQYLIAGSTQIAPGQYVAENPDALGGTWGCDQPPGTTAPLLGPNGTDLPGPFPCYDYQTLGDELDAKALTWRYYAPALGSSGGIWSAYDAIRHIRYGTDWTNDVISPETTVLTDAPNGLPSVTWVVPSFVNSDHAGSGSATGPQWVTSVVNAVGQSPSWSSTAIFIVWDDWGGWFDHVLPPQLDVMGLGFRVPLIVISPYAKHGYVSHTQHEFGSILHFTEETFGLAPLAASDARADDMSDCFDFTQAPQPFAAFRTTMPPSHFVNTIPDGRAPDDD